MCNNEKFYVEAEKRGLSSGFRGISVFLRFKCGPIYGRSEPDKIFSLIELVKECSAETYGGNHFALLNLVAERKKVKKIKESLIGVVLIMWTAKTLKNGFPYVRYLAIVVLM